MKTLAWTALLFCGQLYAQAPERIVVLDAATADTLQALGVANSIIALPKAQMPAYLAPVSREQVVDTGGLDKLAYGQLRQLKPDAIYAPNLNAKTKSALQQIAPTQVLAFHPQQYWQDLERNTLAVAVPHGKQSSAQQSLTLLQQQISNVRQQTKQDSRSVVVLEHNQGHYRWEAQAAYQGLLYGVLQIKRPVNLPTQPTEVTQAQLQQWQADALWVIDISGAKHQQSVDVSVLEEAARGTPALANERIKMLNPSHWTQTAVGLQGVQLQVDDVARMW